MSGDKSDSPCLAPQSVYSSLVSRFDIANLADNQAPPIGGSLYTHFGWNAPFLFCISLCCIDLVARLFVIEQRDLPKYGLESIKEQEAREAGVEAEVEEEVEELSLFGVIKALGSNRRGMTGVMMTAIFGLVDGALDPTYVDLTNRMRR
jgi:DHA1 family vesicular acetylcholine transporter-like MFS transporter 3